MHPDALYTAQQLTEGLKLGSKRFAKLVAAGLKPAHVVDPDGKGVKLELFRLGDVLPLVAPPDAE